MWHRWLVSLVVPALLVPPIAAGSVGTALRDGEWEVDLRYRFERADVDGFDEDGHASTLRTAVLYRSAWLEDFRLGVTFENVTDLGFEDRHADGFNGVARPLIPDPELTEVDEAWLAYRGFHETVIAAGRTRLQFGNQRFVGPVGWRQAQQSFDGVSMRTTAIPRASATLARVRDVRTPNGTRRGIAANLAYVEIDLDRAGTLAPYWIDLDFDDPALAALSTSTIGAAWTGRWGCCRDWTVPFRAEWATQSEAGANPASLDVDYTRFELGASRDEWTLTAIAETLGGGADAGGAFSTPLATLHAFNGWADIFVGGTPPDGLEDRALRLAWRKGDWSASATYHEFSADSGSDDYGTELDAQVVRECASGAQVGLTMASYDAETFAVDVRKLWLWATYRF